MSGSGRPAVPGHLLAPDSLPRLDVPVTPSGLILGQRAPGQPAVVTLFANRPVYVGVFASLYTASLLAFRALAAAADVTVVTPRPASWQPLVRAAPARWVTVVPPGSPTPPAATAARPALICEDIGVVEAPLRRDLGPWQIQLLLRPFLTPQLVAPMRSFDLVLLQRVQPAAVRPIQLAFGLPEQTAEWFARMPDDTVAVLGSRRAHFVNLSPTRIEHGAFGPPTRLDW